MTPRSKPGSRAGRAGRASWTGLRCLLPAALLAVVPKCPMCLAGYVALFTGASLSFTAASRLRAGLILLGATALVWFATQAMRARFGRGS